MGEPAVAEKPLRRIVLAEDRHVLEANVQKYLENPAYAGIHNFPFTNKIDYFNPCSKLTKKYIYSQKSDLVLTELSSDYGYILKTLNKYNIPVLIIGSANEKKETMHALELGAAAVIDARDKEDTLVETVMKLLSGQEVEKRIGFEKPKTPESKIAGPAPRGFSRFSAVASSIFWNKTTHRHKY